MRERKREEGNTLKEIETERKRREREREKRGGWREKY